jgi:hypothetical protein
MHHTHDAQRMLHTAEQLGMKDYGGSDALVRVIIRTTVLTLPSSFHCVKMHDVEKQLKHVTVRA